MLLVAFLLFNLVVLGPLALPALAVEGDLVASSSAETPQPESLLSSTANPRGEAPLVLDDAYRAREGTALAVDAPGVLANDGEASQITSYHALSHSGGTISMDPDGAFRYTPPPGFAGYDAFAYTAGDGQGRSGRATVTIEVEARNERSVAVDLHSFELGDDRQSPVGYVLITNQSDGHGVQVTDVTIAVEVRGQDGEWQDLALVEESCRFGPAAHFTVGDQQLVGFYGCALVEPVPAEATARLRAGVEIYGLVDAGGSAEAWYQSWANNEP
jgi:hypothetical protein